jgi:hypothetical protein
LRQAQVEEVPEANDDDDDDDDDLIIVEHIDEDSHLSQRREIPETPTTSKFFSRSNTKPLQESPDALQDGGPPEQTPLTNPTDSSKPPKRTHTLSARVLGECIEGDSKSTRLTRNPPPKDRGPSQIQKFALKRLAHVDLTPKDDFYSVCVSSKDKAFYFLPSKPILSDDAITQMVSLRQISSVIHGGASGIVSLRLRGSGSYVQEPIVLDLASHKLAWDFLLALHATGETYSIHADKNDEWLEKTYQIYADKYARQQESGTHATDSTTSIDQAKLRNVSHGLAQQKSVLVPRTRMSGRLQQSILSNNRQPTVITGDQRSGIHPHSPEPDSSRPSSSHSAVAERRPSPRLEATLSERVTRSAKREPRPTRRESTPAPPVVKFSKTGGLGARWKEPLVYPLGGKKPETVDFASLERLDDEEFLNDTLIGFFLRYLQDKTDPDQMKKMHVFSSYFFTSLTKNVKKGETINYAAVKNWTKNINLFARDYVIVPINEHAHWFVLIICFLPFFQKLKNEADGIVDFELEQEDPMDVADVATTETQQSFEELRLHDSSKGASTNSPGGKKGRKRKKGLPQRKYEIGNPVIITLDSLDQGRSAEAKVLKEYIVAEAREKLKFDIDVGRIQGMTAKPLPVQSNFSDCGVYVCMYMEQFMCDPKGWIHSWLRRERRPWPEPIYGSELRSRLRSLILNLHQKQQGTDSDVSIPAMGRILIDWEPLAVDATFASVADSSSGRQLSQQVAERVQKSHDNRSGGPQQPTLAHGSGTVPGPVEPIVLDDDPESPVIIPQDVSKKRKRRPNAGLSHYDHPEQLTDELRAYNDEAAEAPATRNRKRSESVSTDFLHSHAPYVQSASTEVEGLPAWDKSREGSAEVPETQQPFDVAFENGQWMRNGGRAGEDEMIVS